MKQLTTKALVLSRTDYNEADRIVNVLTFDQGKISVLARGSRKTKSKLAGGIELLTVCEISYIVGRGEIHTLVSARGLVHYGQIVKSLDRMNLAYEFIKMLNKATEDHTEHEYFDLLNSAFESLNDTSINPELIEIWFKAQLLSLSGHSPNLSTDSQGNKLDQATKYYFNFETMCFVPDSQHDNSFSSDNIKFLRLIFSGNLPHLLQKVTGSEVFIKVCKPLVNSMLQTYVRL